MGLFGKKTETPRKSVQEEMCEREIAELQALLAKYEGARRATANDLETCKADVRKVETALFLKRDEYEKSSGNVRRLVAAEIKGLAELLERQKGEQNLVLKRLDQFDAMIAKYKETIQIIRSSGVAGDAGELETVRREAEEQVERDAVAVRRLENVGRATQTEDDFDVDALFARLEAETKAPARDADKDADEIDKIDAIIAKATRGAARETL